MRDESVAGAATVPRDPAEDRVAQLEQYRGELRRYCQRILGSGFETEDAVQETLLRAWRGLEAFEGRSSIRTWLFRIATNVCLGMLSASQRRAAPVSIAIGVAGDAMDSAIDQADAILGVRPEGGDPASVAIDREFVRLAWIAALHSLSPRQRAVLILRDVLHWRAAEVGELLGVTTAAVNSSLQRARASLASRRGTGATVPGVLDDTGRALLTRYLEAFEGHDIEGLVALVRSDAGACRDLARERPSGGSAAAR